MELEFRSVDCYGGRKTGEPLEQGENQQTQTTRDTEYGNRTRVGGLRRALFHCGPLLKEPLSVLIKLTNDDSMLFHVHLKSSKASLFLFKAFMALLSEAFPPEYYLVSIM